MLTVSLDGIPGLSNLALAHDGIEVWNMDSHFTMGIVVRSQLRDGCYVTLCGRGFSVHELKIKLG